MSIQPESAPPPPPPPPREPAIKLPRTVKLLCILMILVHVVLMLLPWQWYQTVLIHLSFIPGRYTLSGGFGWSALFGPVTHQFLHGGLLHLGINTVMLAAFGSGLEQVLGGRRLMILFLVSGLAGALTHFLFYPYSTTPVIGASGAISGLFGGILRVLGKHSRVHAPPPKLWPIALIWIAIAVGTGFLGMPGAGGAQVAWAAHIGGFVFGLLFFSLFTIGLKPQSYRPPV